MTIQEAVTKATEGGYHIHAADGMDTDYVDANSEYSVWTRKDNASSFIVLWQKRSWIPFLAGAWPCAGVGSGSEDGAHCENGRPTMVTRAGQHWLSHWHRFIDHLAAGKSPEAFFDTLAFPQAKEN